MYSICRTCGEVLNNIHDVSLNEGERLMQQIELLTGLLFEQVENLPFHVCTHCQRDLNDAITFRELCINTQNQWLKKMMLKRQKEQVMEKYNVNVYEVVYIDDNSIELKEIHEHRLIDLKNDNINVEDLTNPAQRLSQEELVAHEERLACEEYVENSTLHVKKQTQKKYFCEKCDKHFTNSSNFKLHMLRHDGTKNYECKICNKKFYARHFLIKHKLKHGNKRPYQCRYCKNSFRSWSNRSDHERKHTNERPYNCQHCEKSFFTSSTRNDHELVHTNIRNFNCEICNQWFLRRTHLLRHFSSKTHKQNALQKVT